MRHQGILPADLFAGRTVFVTGGGSGINLGVAHAFAGLGAAIAICGRSQERLDSAAAALRAVGTTVFAQAADVRQPEQLEAAISGAGAALAETLSPNGFKTVVDIDLLGSFNAARLAFDQLARTRGSLIFISAPQAHMAHACQAHVGAAKAGVEMLMRNLAVEWGPHGIRCNSIIPGLVENTEGLSRIASPERHGRMLGHIPLRRMGAVEEIGDAAVFLASPLAAYVTGTSLWVDGGQGLPGAGLFNANAADFLAAKG